MLQRRLALAHVDHHAALEVRDHLAGLEIDSPGGEQRLEVRGLVGHELRHGIVRIRRRLVGLGIRIDEHQHAAAVQRELVDGVERRGRQVFRVNDDQHVDVIPDRGQRGLEIAHGVELFGLAIDHPGLARPAGLHVEVALHGQRRQPADDGLLRARQLVDQLGDVVFELLFGLRIEIRDGFLAIGGIGGGEAEVALLATLVDGHRRDAEFVGAIFFLGVRLRIDDLERELAVGARHQLFEQLAHARGVIAQRRIRRGRLLGEIQVEVHRLLEAVHDVFGALGNGEQLVGGEVELGAAQQQVGQQHDADEQHADDGQATDTESGFLEHG